MILTISPLTKNGGSIPAKKGHRTNQRNRYSYGSRGRGKDILIQLLIEAVILSLIGGLLGILAGLGLGFVLQLPIILISFIFTGVVDIFSDYIRRRRPLSSIQSMPCGTNKLYTSLHNLTVT